MQDRRGRAEGAGRMLWAAPAVGLLLCLIGALLLGGGVWLILLGGSWYYAAAGFGLLMSGMMMMVHDVRGAVLYIAIYLATWVWAVWEVGFDPWPLVPRVVAPTVILLLVLLCVPSLQRARAGAFGAALLLLGPGGLMPAASVRAQEGPVPAEAPPAQEPLAPVPTTAPGPAPVRTTGADWPAYGGTNEALRFSPLGAITAENVGDLERVWVYRTGDLPQGDENYAAETTPLVIDGRMYLCTALNDMMALDAATGAELWRHEAGVTEEFIPYNATCRGVAWFELAGDGEDEACAARVIQGTLDARLVALDAATGLPCPGFGAGGAVDLLERMGDPAPGFVTVTSPPTIVRDVIVVGHQVRDGQRRDAPSGVIRGYDAVTGELRWAWDMLRPGEKGPPPEGETYGLGTPNMWTIASGDDALGLVYLPMGNSAVDYYGAQRSEVENQYATALVAIDVTTGDVAWSFQTVRYDVWDYDLGSQGTLVDFPTADGPVPAIVLPSKQGDIYVLDRATGEALVPVEERPAPTGGVEPENLSPTQPFSGYHTLAKRDLEERDMWGMSPLDQLWCRIQFRRAHYNGIYTPPTADRSWVQYPGYNGGSDWGGIAFDPERGIIVANYNDMPNHNRLIPREEVEARGVRPMDEGGSDDAAPDDWDPQAGTPWGIHVNAGWRVPGTGLLCKQPPYGGIRAIDIASGETLWDEPLGTARRNGPFGLSSYLPFPIGTPNNGGAVLTAGGLAFIAAATDDLIRAIDVATGEVVWQEALPAGGQATPITYEVNGRQYVAIMAGGHSFMETPIGDHVIAWALPGR